ncbi:MAG: pyridoxal-dependent decarboxylase [bacterium]|nr:pyridoxal-dependent decarboxylase [bacterium]MDE0290136.1 pyridoxal-dependent decarboxylase [bacterium]MDE0437383.1 pyridoxal-dependent decarboxylase [bacterium]
MSDRYDMTPEEFRRHGYAMVDWLAGYMERVGELPVQSRVDPGWVRGMLPDRAPEEPEKFEAVAADLDRIVVPGLTNWTSPGWFAYFPCTTSGPGMLGELVAAGLDQQGMLWATSPVCTELESVMMDWMVDLLGLPGGWKTTAKGGGVMQQTASDAAHVALVVARDRAQRQGADISRCVAYTSTQAHSSIEKGARVAGYQHIRLVDVDDVYSMDVGRLAAAVADDRDSGLVPTFVCSAVGTTATTAVDPVRTVGELARDEGMWHHVDAAFAGNAMFCEEFRHHQDGLELVDSYTVNPYKWTPMTFDGSLFFVADRAPLIHALSILPEYLRNEASESGQVIDYRDWHVALGRRFRSLKLWFVLRYYGASGVRTRIRAHIGWARDFAARIEEDDRLELVAPVPFSLVCFRHRAGNDATESLANEVNRSGHSFLTRSRVDGMSFLRVSIGQVNTRKEHVERLWRLIDGKALPFA